MMAIEHLTALFSSSKLLWLLRPQVGSTLGSADFFFSMSRSMMLSAFASSLAAILLLVSLLGAGPSSYSSSEESEASLVLLIVALFPLPRGLCVALISFPKSALSRGVLSSALLSPNNRTVVG